jgi:hypothetical protein
MSNDQKVSEREQVKIQVNESLHVVESTTPKLLLIREYIKRNPGFLFLWIVLNVLNCLMGLFVIGVTSVFLAVAINGLSAWVGYRAITKVREEKGG